MTDNGRASLLRLLHARRAQVSEREALDADGAHDQPLEAKSQEVSPDTTRRPAPDAGPPPLAADAKALARMLGLSVRTVRAMDAAGKLPRPIRLGHAVRWPLKTIEDWLAAGAPERRTWEAMKGTRR